MDHFDLIVAFEVILIFGGLLLFAWWQLRDIRQEQKKASKNKASPSSKEK